MKTQFTIISLFLLVFGFTQNDTLIKGKIILETNYNIDVTVINLNTKINTISDKDGYFEIKAKINDTIVFCALNLDLIKHKVIQNNFSKDLVFIKMYAKSREIEKILITNNSISAESLGLVPKGQKRYTVAERRLTSATSGFGIGGIINYLNGETEKLKRAVEIEKKEMLQEKILRIFEKEIFIKTLKIPEENITGFLFFVADDKTALEIFKNKDIVKQLFYLTDRSTKYLLALKKTNIIESK